MGSPGEPSDPAGEPGRVARIPLFPLGSVLYPGLLLPLHIFEERYRRLVADLTGGAPLPGPDATEETPVPAFGVVAILAGRETRTPTAPELFGVGCTAELRRVEPLPGGRFDILTTGAQRFRLLDLDASGPYLEGRVEYLDEPPGEEADVLAPTVAAHYVAYRDLLLSTQGQPPRVRGGLPRDPVVLSYLIAAAMVLDLHDKQRLLEADDATARLRAELELLRRERTMLARLPSLPGAAELARAAVSPN